MPWRALLLVTSLLLFHLVGMAQQKNVLLIIVDDLRPELNCYGEEHMHTPNIDSLAKNGVLFENAHVQQAVCPASRASFLSAARPNSTGTDYPYSNYYVNEFLYWNPTLQKHFYESGYHASTWGKVHHGGYKDKKNVDISLKAYKPPGTAKYALAENLDSTKEKKAATESAPVHDTAYRDGLITLNATAEMKHIATDGTPFFMAVGYHKPHLPFAAPQKYWDLYDRETIPLSPAPKKPTNSPDYVLAHTALRNYTKENDENGQLLSEEYARELRHGYFACVSYIDAQVGQLIASLKENGLYENTVIVLMSDHGWHLGDNGMWGKSTNYERATKIPLIVSNYNGYIGTRSQLVEAVDVFPTLCDLVEVPTPTHTEGTSFKPLLQSPTTSWKRAVFSQYPRSAVNKHLEGYAVRTERYRYIEWKNNETGVVVDRELYDHQNDPYETKNIVAQTNMVEVAKTHANILSEGWKESLPSGTINGSNNGIAPPSQRYRKDAPYILTQDSVDIAVNHPYTIGLKDLDLVVDKNDTFPKGFSLHVKSGEYYQKSENVIRPDLRFEGWLEVPVFVLDTNGNRSNVFLFRIQVRPPITIREKAYADRAEIEIDYAADDYQERVTQSFTLPTEGRYGSQITWTSEDSLLISQSGHFDNNLIPEEGFKPHLMRATLVNNGLERYRNFQLRLVPRYGEAQVFPNPNNGDFSLYHSQKFNRIEIFNEAGQKVWEASFEPTFYKKLILRDVNKGLYLVRLYEASSGNVAVTRFLLPSTH